MSIERLTITGLGQRGEGKAVASRGVVYVPYSVPGDVVMADVDGEQAHVVELIDPSSDRIEPVCPYFGTCGGCAVQSVGPTLYGAWKRQLVAEVLAKAGVVAEVLPVIWAHGEGRRRATFHARVQPSPNVLKAQSLRVGFMRARAHEVIDIAECPVLAPSMRPALAAARALADALAALRKPLDLVVTATDGGLDVDLRGIGPIDAVTNQIVAELAGRFDLARVSNHGEIIIERRAPTLRMGDATVTCPPGAFLQATAEGERVLAELVLTGVGSARKIADLYCGLGTFALRLAGTATVTAIDNEGPSLAALSRAARASPRLRPVTTMARDLMRRPLSTDELKGFDAVVFDPPRGGAEAQAAALASSVVPVVVAVSCNPATFARDAATLIAGGYRLERVTPVDQFLYAAHVELVAIFRRAKGKKAGRSLFG